MTDQPNTTTAQSTDVPDVADREVLTWEGFGVASRELTQQIVDSGWIPELIVAIARGGLIPAGAISYAMDVKACGTMNVEFYTGVGETLEAPVLLPPLMDISAMEGKRVLIVDDVADQVKVDARSVCIYKKSRSIITPDYIWAETDKWINFPWSTLPTITANA